MNRKIKPEEWQKYLDVYGFCSGCSVIGLKMLGIAAVKKSLIESNQRRIERSREYHRAYRIRNKERLSAYRHELYMRNIEEERARRRKYYNQHKDKWFKYRNTSRKENYAEE